MPRMIHEGTRSASVSVVGALAAAVVLGSLGACGQKGPLYLPGGTAQGAGATVPTSSAASAAAPTASGPSR